MSAKSILVSVVALVAAIGLSVALPSRSDSSKVESMPSGAGDSGRRGPLSPAKCVGTIKLGQSC